MSRRPTVRAKQRKNPLLPADSLAFTVRRAAALPAAPPAEAEASPARVLPVAADFPRTPRETAVSPARVLLAAEVLVVALAILTAALAALVQKQIHLAVAARSGEGPAAHPEALVSAVHSPKPLRKRKYPSPVQQEPGRRRQQESRPAAHSVLPFLNPGTVGMRPRYLSRPHQGRRAPARHSRNSAGAPGRTGTR